MNILVTGGAGYIGTHTLVELLNRGHDVVVVDNYVNSHPESLDRVREITGKSFPFYEANVCDEAALDRIFDENKVDCVIHFAGLKAVGESCAKPLMYYRNNLDGMLSLISSMRKHDVKRFVFSSSATVYRSDAGMPVDEDSPLGCINPYGWTKFMGEEILRDVAKAEPDWSVVLLRYFNPIGAHESGKIGEDPNGVPNNLMPYITQTALGRLKELHVFGNDYPTPDGTGEGYSVLDIVHAFERVNHVKVPYEIAPRRAGDPPTVFAKVGKAERLLHWKAKRTLDQMCADSWRWQTQNPHGYAKEK